MPLPIIPNLVRTAVEGALPSGRPWANVLHFDFVGGGSPSSGNIAALHALIQRLYLGTDYAGGAYLLKYCKTTVTTTQVRYTPLDGSATTTVTAMAGAGLETGASLPSETAMVLTLRSNLRGRSNRGRIYLPVDAAASFNADGSYASARITARIAQTTGFIAALPAVSWVWVIASYLHSTAVDVQSITMDNKADVIRRRK